MEQALGTYLDRDVAEHILHEGPSLKAHEVDVTMMFVDIRGFTSFAERFAPARRRPDPQLPVRARGADHRGQRGGHVDKFVGDGLLAVFGAPGAAGRPRRLRRRGGAGDRERAAEERFQGDLEIGIGIDSGTVVAGNVGGGGRLDFTVIGDAVNTAARIEQATRATGDTILFSDQTRRRLWRSELLTKERDAVPIKGKRDPVRLFVPAVAGRIGEDDRPGRRAGGAAVAWLIGLRDLQWGRRRFAIGVVATALVFALGLLMSGVSASFDNEIHRTVDVVRRGRLARAGAELRALHRARRRSPRRAPQSVRDLPGVAARRPGGRPARHDRDPGARQREPDRRRSRRRGLARPGGRRGCCRGAAPRSPTRASAWTSGDRLDLNGAGFRVGALTSRHDLLRRDTDRDGLAGATRSGSDSAAAGLATAVVTEGRPAAVPRGLTVLENGAVEEDLGRPVRQAKQTIGLIRLLLWAVAAGIIGAIVYLSVLERVRDLAALKAIGVGTRDLVSALDPPGRPALPAVGAAVGGAGGGDRAGRRDVRGGARPDLPHAVRWSPWPSASPRA